MNYRERIDDIQRQITPAARRALQLISIFQKFSTISLFANELLIMTVAALPKANAMQYKPAALNTPGLVFMIIQAPAHRMQSQISVMGSARGQNQCRSVPRS